MLIILIKVFTELICNAQGIDVKGELIVSTDRIE